MLRKSKVDVGEATTLVQDAVQRAHLEARNALLQFDEAVRIISDSTRNAGSFVLRPSLLCRLNWLATKDVSGLAGVFRPSRVTITNSAHVPPDPSEVIPLVEEMCDYVNLGSGHPPLHRSAYLLWRLNWIHPFADGNGRTARIISYIVLCTSLGFLLPGTRTIPEQISDDKGPYYAALEAADRAFANGATDVGLLEEMLSRMLAAQLLAVHDSALGPRPS